MKNSLTILEVNKPSAVSLASLPRSSRARKPSAAGGGTLFVIHETFAGEHYEYKEVQGGGTESFASGKSAPKHGFRLPIPCQSSSATSIATAENHSQSQTESQWKKVLSTVLYQRRTREEIEQILGITSGAATARINWLKNPYYTRNKERIPLPPYVAVVGETLSQYNQPCEIYLATAEGLRAITERNLNHG